MYITDKTVLLLIVVTCFDVIRNCLALTVFKTSANTANVNTWLSYSWCSKSLPPASSYSLNLFLKCETALFSGKFPRVFSTATFNSETIWLGIKLLTSCARGDTICHRPSPPSVGAEAPHAATPTATWCAENTPWRLPPEKPPKL